MVPMIIWHSSGLSTQTARMAVLAHSTMAILGLSSGTLVARHDNY